MNAQDLIDELQETVRGQIARANEVAAMSPERLMKRPAPQQWNVLEVFEHMNLSSGIYVRGLRKVFDAKAAALKPNSIYRPGLLGDYFTTGMLPKDDGSIRNRMRTMRMFDPQRNQGASLQSISAFIGMCEEQVQLLERARSTDLNGMRVTSSLGPIIRFKAGDAFRFPIAHQARHMLQVERLLA